MSCQGGILTINGDRYMEYTLQIDLTVSDNLTFGNQFEFYIKKTTDEEYSRVLPIQASWGASNSLEGYQLLNNSTLNQDSLSKAKMIHNIISSVDWANYTVSNWTSLFLTAIGQMKMNLRFNRDYFPDTVLLPPEVWSLMQQPAVVGAIGAVTTGTGIAVSIMEYVKKQINDRLQIPSKLRRITIFTNRCFIYKWIPC